MGRGLTLTPPFPLLAPQLHAGPDTEADVLTECLVLQQLHASTQLAASDGKGGCGLGQELLPGTCAGRQGQGRSPGGAFLCPQSRTSDAQWAAHMGMTCCRHSLIWTWLPLPLAPYFQSIFSLQLV